MACMIPAMRQLLSANGRAVARVREQMVHEKIMWRIEWGEAWARRDTGIEVVYQVLPGILIP